MYLTTICKPCPLEVLKDITKFFKIKYSESDFNDLANIFSNLYTYILKTIYIVDRFNELDRKEVEKVLYVVWQLFIGKL